MHNFLSHRSILHNNAPAFLDCFYSAFWFWFTVQCLRWSRNGSIIKYANATLFQSTSRSFIFLCEFSFYFIFFFFSIIQKLPNFVFMVTNPCQNIVICCLIKHERKKNIIFFPVLDFRHTPHNVEAFHSKYLFASHWNFLSLTVNSFFFQKKKKIKYQFSPKMWVSVGLFSARILMFSFA